MTIQAVIYDIGNVLIEWNPERFYDRAIGTERRKAMFGAIDLHGMNDAVDRGADWQAEVAKCAAQFPDWRDEILMWHSHWLHMASPPIPQSLDLLRALRTKGVPVFALSNFGIQTFEVGEKAYPFLTEFDRRYISGHMGVIKPEARIYEMVEQDCGLPPDSLLFTDDRIDNITAAQARGWQTHLFTGAQGWADRLITEGLLTQGEVA